MLDAYLNSLDEAEQEKTASQARFGAASVDELAKLAGVELGEHICTNCSGAMEKLGSIWRCDCGMMKHAGKGKQYAKDLQKFVKPGRPMSESIRLYNEKYKTAMAKCGTKTTADYSVDPGWIDAQLGMHRSKRSSDKGIGQFLGNNELMGRRTKSMLSGGAIGGALGGMLGAGVGAIAAGKISRGAGAVVGGAIGVLGGGTLGAGVGGTKADIDYLRSKGIDSKLLGLGGARFTEEAARKYLPKQASAPIEMTKEAAFKVCELIALNDYDFEKTAVVLEAQGMDKEAIWGALSGIGRGVAAGAKALGKGQVARAGRAVVGGAKRTGGALKRTFLEGGAQTAGQAGGTMAGLKAVAKANPALVAGAGATGVGGAGYAMGKMSSDSHLLKVADAAGRLLAKTAQTGMNVPIPIDEIRESIQEAQGREDVSGRARRWQIGGGIAGGSAGGLAGAAPGMLMKRPGLGLLGGLAGAGLGAYAGQGAGKAHGAEEARADKAVSMLRAMRAHQTGAMSGYGAGMRRGYSMGGSGGGSSEEEKQAMSPAAIRMLYGGGGAALGSGTGALVASEGNRLKGALSGAALGAVGGSMGGFGGALSKLLRTPGVRELVRQKASRGTPLVREWAREAWGAKRALGAGGAGAGGAGAGALAGRLHRDSEKTGAQKIVDRMDERLGDEAP